MKKNKKCVQTIFFGIRGYFEIISLKSCQRRISTGSV